MLRIVLALCLSISLGLIACAKAPANAIVPIPKKVLTAEQDPDGDGENKGHAHFSTNHTPTGKRVFIFDPNYNAWAAYNEQGKRVNTGRASGGRLYCPDTKMACKTIVGDFAVYRMKGADCKSGKYPLETRGGASMPYCMFFDHRGYAIHGSGDVPDYNASHGCIRVTSIAAKWLSEHFMRIGTTVVVLPYQSN